MIPLFIFYVHIIAGATAFTKEYQKEGVSAGLLSVGFMVLIFSVGWSISTFILKYMIREAGFGIWLNRDALSLILLSVAEMFFYYFYYREETNRPVVKQQSQ
jgi:hypothetical protein